jgi:hypothetical protein
MGFTNSGYTNEADSAVSSGVGGAYGARVGQFNALQSGVDAAQQGAMKALQGQQSIVDQMPGTLETARKAAMGSVRQGAAQGIGAAGAQANSGAGGLGNLSQAGLVGGNQMAKTGADLAASNLEAMQMAGQRLGSMAGDVQGLATSGFDAMNEAGGSLEAIRANALADARSSMSDIFGKYDGFYNNDQEEAAYEAAMQAEIAAAEDPVVRKALEDLKLQYDAQFYDDFETSEAAKVK